MVALAEAVVTGPGLEILVETLVSQAHLVIQGISARHHPSSGLGTLLPVVHVVLLESPRWAKDPHSGQSNGFLDLRRRGLVHVDPRPHFGLVRPPRVPDTQCARGGSKHREVREDRASDRLDEPQAW